MFDKEGIKIILLDRMLDTQYIHTVESNNSDIKFIRIDADVAGALKGEGEALEDEKITALFKKISGNEELKVSYECLKDEKTPALINVNE